MTCLPKKTKLELLLIIIRILLLLLKSETLCMAYSGAKVKFGITANEFVSSPSREEGNKDGMIYTQLYRDILIAIKNESLKQNGTIWIISHEFHVKPIMQALLHNVVINNLNLNIILDGAVWNEDGNDSDERGIYNYWLWVAWYKAYLEYKETALKRSYDIGSVKLYIFNGNYSSSGLPLDQKHPCAPNSSSDSNKNINTTYEKLCYNKQSSNDACCNKKISDTEYTENNDPKCLDSNSLDFDGNCSSAEYDGVRCKFKTGFCDVNGYNVTDPSFVLQSPDANNISDASCCNKSGLGLEYTSIECENNPDESGYAPYKCTGTNKGFNCDCCAKIKDDSSQCKAYYKECQYSRCTCQWRYERLHAKFWVFEKTEIVFGGSWNCTYSSVGKWVDGYPEQELNPDKCEAGVKWLWMYNIENYLKLEKLQYNQNMKWSEYWINEWNNLKLWGNYYSINQWERSKRDIQKYKYISPANERLDILSEDSIMLKFWLEFMENKWKLGNYENEWCGNDPEKWEKFDLVVTNLPFFTEFIDSNLNDLKLVDDFTFDNEIDDTPDKYGLETHLYKYNNCKLSTIKTTDQQPLPDIISSVGYYKSHTSAGIPYATYNGTERNYISYNNTNEDDRWDNRHIDLSCQTPLLNNIIALILNAKNHIIIPQYNFSHTGTWLNEWSVIVDALIQVITNKYNKRENFVFQIIIDENKLLEKSSMLNNFERLYTIIREFNKEISNIVDLNGDIIHGENSGILVLLDHCTDNFQKPYPPNQYNFLTDFTFGINKFHVKYMIIDNVFFNGSFNWSNKAFGKSNGKINIELFCIFELGNEQTYQIMKYTKNFILYSKFSLKPNDDSFEGINSIDFINFL